jgi:uncharacterized membrane protein (UPF0127 family)
MITNSWDELWSKALRQPFALLAVAAACACSDAQDSVDYSGVVKFDTTTVRIVTPGGVTRLHVELAMSPEQRSMGLMERSSLSDSAGMLFLYDKDEPATSGFWMYRTRIPLDIAFLDSTGRVVAIRRMTPCTATLASGCPTYEAGVPYRAALEVSAGALARYGIAPGAQVELPVHRDAK